MTNFVTLACPTCGAKLEITDEDERFACIHCGNEHVVKRGGGKVSLKPVIESIGKVQKGVDKTASELAIKRLKQEIIDLEEDLKNARGANIDVIRSGFIMVIFGVLITIFAFSTADGKAGVICVGIFFALAAIVGLIIGFQALLKGNQGTIDSITSQLGHKRKELRHHQDIVNKI